MLLLLLLLLLYWMLMPPLLVSKCVVIPCPRCMAAVAHRSWSWTPPCLHSRGSRLQHSATI